jgi:phage gp36-like protein
VEYCTYNDLLNCMAEQSVVQLTDDSGTNVVDTTKVAAAITASSQEIDGYIRGRYRLPLAQIPELLRDLCARMTRFRLYDRRENGVPEAVAASYKAGVDVLKMISAGTVTLGEPGSGVDHPAAEAKAITNKTPNDRYFSDSLLQGY